MYMKFLHSTSFVRGVGAKILFVLAFFVLPVSVHAAIQYSPMILIPGMNTSGATSLPVLINSIYVLAIAVGAIFAVIKIALAGVKYSMDDVITSKQAAKDDIKGVLMGLAILLIPFIVLNTINPDLVNMNVLTSMSRMGQGVNPTGSGGGGVNPNNAIQNGNNQTRTTCSCTENSSGSGVDCDTCQASCTSNGGTFTGPTESVYDPAKKDWTAASYASSCTYFVD